MAGENNVAQKIKEREMAKEEEKKEIRRQEEARRERERREAKNAEVANNAADIVKKRREEKKRESASKIIFEGLKDFLESSDDVCEANGLFMYVDEDGCVKGKLDDLYFYVRPSKNGGVFIRFVDNCEVKCTRVTSQQTGVYQYSNINVVYNKTFVEDGLVVKLDGEGKVEAVAEKKKKISMGKDNINDKSCCVRTALKKAAAHAYLCDRDGYDVRLEIDSKQKEFSRKKNNKR